jgi:proline iminopeptidase
MLRLLRVVVPVLVTCAAVGIHGFTPLPPPWSTTRRRTQQHHYSQPLLHGRTQNINRVSSSSSNDEDAGLLRGLYQPSNTHANGTLLFIADDIVGRPVQHEVYYEVHGAPDAPLAALFLHGGPGAGCFPNHARFFDPSLYRIILMDQRGSGRSIPRGGTVGNTLLDIVCDCESLRNHLNIEKWSTILGGSWGVTVAVAYAQEFPQRVQSIILRGVCLFRAREIDWMFSSAGYAQQNPAAWDDFTSAVVVTAPSDNDEGSTTFSSLPDPRETLYRYYDRLLGDNTSLRIQAARSWMGYEMQVYSSSSSWSTSTTNEPADNNTVPVVAVLQNSKWSYRDGRGNVLSESSIDEMRLPRHCVDLVQRLREALPIISADDNLIASPRLVRPVLQVENATVGEEEASLFVPAQNMLTCYYSVNRSFVMNGIDLLDPVRMMRIQHIPCIAVHGRMDRVCPVTTALDLAEAWPNLQLRVPMRSGHSMYDAAIANELVRATDCVAQMLLMSPLANAPDTGPIGPPAGNVNTMSSSQHS